MFNTLRHSTTLLASMAPIMCGLATPAFSQAPTDAQRSATVARVGALRDRLADGLRDAIPGTHESAVGDDRNRSNKVAGACHLCFDGIESEALLFLMEKDGVFASAASSCARGAQDPSHVLAAMGVSRSSVEKYMMASLRLIVAKVGRWP